MAGIKGTLLRAFYAETGSLTDRKKPAKSYDFADFLVRPTRFERATYRVGVCQSIQLSYERIYEINSKTPVIAF